jgi:hypothetical protein
VSLVPRLKELSPTIRALWRANAHLRGSGGLHGGRDRDRTCDPYDVNLILVVFRRLILGQLDSSQSRIFRSKIPDLRVETI